MTETEFRKLFPRGSKSFASANPLLVTQKAEQNALQGNLKRSSGKRGTMNKTETEFSFLLEAQKRNGDIADYKFEGITLRWDELRFTPDFIVFPSPLVVSARIKLIETKGPFIGGNRERAVERFRHARTYWTQFDFELHQKTKSEGWKRLI